VEWFASLGSAIRAEMPRRNDQNLSLLGASMKDDFRRQQIVSFMSFWRVFLGVSFGMIMLVFIGSYFFLLRMESDLKSSLGGAGSSEAVQVELFRKDADRFNALVSLISLARKPLESKAAVLVKVNSILESSGLTLTQFNFTGFNTNLTLLGRGKSQADVLGFEDKLRKDEQFKDVKQLSPTDIKVDDQGVSFSISFSMIPPKVE